MPFCKYRDAQLLIAENFVYGPSFTLLADSHQESQYPIDGWYWFYTVEEAKAFFQITIDNIPTDPNIDPTLG